MSTPVWFITGASNGFGQILCMRALQAKHRVIGSVRSRAKAVETVKEIEDAGGKIIEMDMTEPKESIDRKIKAIGHIDYLINNAGYALVGALEHHTEEESRTQVNTNVFGPLFVMQAALDGMRARHTGTIVNVSSIAAKDPNAISALYAASKAALEAMSEALAKEVAPFGISILIIEPGAFRTKFLHSMVLAKEVCPDHYKETPVGTMLDKFNKMTGNQVGDPVKGVERMFEVITGEGMAGHLKGKILRLVLGDDALQRMTQNNNKFLGDLKAGEQVTKSTDFD